MAILVECPTCRRKQSNKNKVCNFGQDMDRAKRLRKKESAPGCRFPRSAFKNGQCQ